MSEEDNQLALRRTRQKVTATLVASFLIGMGICLIFVFKRAPLPLRIIGGLGNIVAGYALLVLVRQRFRK